MAKSSFTKCSTIAKASPIRDVPSKITDHYFPSISWQIRLSFSWRMNGTVTGVFYCCAALTYQQCTSPWLLSLLIFLALLKFCWLDMLRDDAVLKANIFLAGFAKEVTICDRKGSWLNSLTRWLGVTFFGSEATGPLHLRFPVGLSFSFVWNICRNGRPETIQQRYNSRTTCARIRVSLTRTRTRAQTQISAVVIARIRTAWGHDRH